MKKPVYVIDAMNYIFRAYHALPDNITAPSGMLTNAVLGYLRTLLRIIKERRPEYMAAAFEGDTSFRSTMFAAYKATRKQTPDDLEAQFDYCRRITEAVGIACLEADDYEADDVIGTITMRMTALGHPVVIVTGDKDMSQLVCDNVQIYEGQLASLKRFKDDAREVKNGLECGLGIQNYNDIKPGDVIEAYEIVNVQQEL